MRSHLRIVAGSLRGRKLACTVHPDMRPTPQMVREALFSILGNAVPDRLFVDIFGGTGIVGVEALSRGASQTYFIERDYRQAQEIEGHLRTFDLTKRAKLYRTDAYRWIAAWQPPADPVNIFFSPPFPDLTDRPADLLGAIRTLQQKVADGSVILLQSERGAPLEDDPALADWELRRYGRNHLLLGQKEESEGVGSGESGIGEEATADQE